MKRFILLAAVAGTFLAAPTQAGVKEWSCRICQEATYSPACTVCTIATIFDWWGGF